jgi:hypothetical protein
MGIRGARGDKKMQMNMRWDMGGGIRIRYAHMRVLMSIIYTTKLSDIMLISMLTSFLQDFDTYTSVLMGYQNPVCSL